MGLRFRDFGLGVWGLGFRLPPGCKNMLKGLGFGNSLHAGATCAAPVVPESRAVGVTRLPVPREPNTP